MVELYHQFCLRSRPPQAAIPGWRRLDAAGWWLATHPTLPAVRIEAGSRRIGVLLGWAVHPTRGLLHEDETLDVGAREPEDWIYELGGRYCVFLWDSSNRGARARGGRLYLDPIGCLALVYDPYAQAAASTTTALRHPQKPHLLVAGDELRPNQFHPAGLTPDEDARRLLPNHYLDLHSWQAIRHWPARPLPRVAEDDEPAIQALVATIIHHVRHIIVSVAREYPVYLPLTAGRDSRMLLACARPVTDRVTFVTFDYPDERARDLHIAKKMAKRFGLRHKVVALAKPTDQDRAAYLERIGHAGTSGKVQDFDLACRQSLDLSHAWLTGFGGEIGRTYYGREEDAVKEPTAAAYLERIRLPLTHRNLAAWTAWQAGVPHSDAYDLADIVYLEQRDGTWACPHMYGAAAFACNLTPYSSRAAIDAMMQLPSAYKMRKQLADDIMRNAWPELEAIPYQAYTGLRALRELLAKWRRGALRRIRNLQSAATRAPKP